MQQPSRCPRRGYEKLLDPTIVLKPNDTPKTMIGTMKAGDNRALRSYESAIFRNCKTEGIPRGRVPGSDDRKTTYFGQNLSPENEQFHINAYRRAGISDLIFPSRLLNPTLMATAPFLNCFVHRAKFRRTFDCLSKQKRIQIRRPSGPRNPAQNCKMKRPMNMEANL